MVLRRELPLPLTHHLVLVEEVADAIDSNLARLGHLRGLVVVQLNANGSYRLSIAPAESANVMFVNSLGVPRGVAASIVDTLANYDVTKRALVLVTETNPVDGYQFSICELALD